MPLVTGETWFKVPETVEIRFVNQPPFGIGGKDAILYVLQQLKRNTVAFERSLDGCFIGACTTAEEDLILAALVLEAGLKKGLVPALGGKRKVTPGSVPIVAKLRRLGLLKIYEQAGFVVGAPGCSYCIAVAADQAGEGEVWLSSQNRNFRNRMGKGAIGNLASAATVAASSFDMKIRNPRDLLDSIDRARYEEMLEQWIEKGKPVVYSEPVPIYYDPKNTDASLPAPPPSFSATITGRVQRFEDNIDTDAIIPAQFMPGTSDVDLGTHAFQFVKPEFRDLAKQGFDIVVGGSGFGSGSSREEAPRALLGAGIKAVIAKSYAFIYARNQPNMSLLGITIEDESFYTHAQEGAEVSIDVKERKVHCGGQVYPFGLSLMEERLLAGGGVTEMYKTYGKQLFRVATAPEKPASSCGSEIKAAEKSNCGDDSELACWHHDYHVTENRNQQALTEALDALTTSLTTFDLRCNSIGDDGGQALGEALKTNSTLATLNVQDNSIGDKGGKALGEALKTNSTLATLDLRDNSIRDNGGQALAEALKTNSTLETLELGYNLIWYKGLLGFSQALKTNSTLTTLDLTCNLTEDNGA
ncbi:hypothetical protein BGZ92_003201 [Podila epicladia]|nr:hypothetical protein BGZ92_003201 [Podila epicladia]